MYRDVDIEKYYEMCTKTEYKQSIKYIYNVRPLLQSYFADFAQFGDCEGKGLGLEPHLERLTEVYNRVVRPMVIELKSIMRSNNLLNEAEMFCTDLEFRADDQGHVREYIGDLAKKQDDVVKNI